MAESGTLSPNAQRLVFLATKNPREAVIAWEKVNQGVEISQTAEREEGGKSTRTTTADKDTKSPSQSLYDHLAQRTSCKEEHGALVQLSGWAFPPSQAEFHLFLSCCSIVEPHLRPQEYHKTLCILDR